MTPTVPVPTDNIYKFSCLFGLALIVSGIFALVSTYTASLDKKIKYSEVLIALEAQTQKTKVDKDRIEMNRKLIALTKVNEKVANKWIGSAIGIGLFLSLYGAFRWYTVIHPRDNRLAALQIEKLEAEIEKIRAETNRA